MNYYLAQNGVGIANYVKELLKPNDGVVEVVLDGVALPAVQVVVAYKSLSRAAKVFVDFLHKSI